MNRLFLAVAGVFSASSLLLVDSAIKGTALLMLAAIIALIMRRDSAATRHLVWMLAIVAMLAVPMLSVLLPQWRVLPTWATVSSAPLAVVSSPPSNDMPAVGGIEWPQNVQPDVESPAATVDQPATAPPDSPPTLATPDAMPASTIRSQNWFSALPFVWAVGFCVLLLRLMAAQCVLWNVGRRGVVVESSRQPATSDDPIVSALEVARLQLRLRRPISLLIHPDKTIPIVWGILRCRLLLPVAAGQWSGEQLRSVLLHELAHIKRRDTIAQLLTQIACALHWFNPLVWFAAWRLGVERERACDDLVLASGVRPSAYAGHLLEVVTKLSPARWTQSCGLAMARRSSLEGRLVAVLSGNLNRRGVSVALAAIALAIAVGIAVPIAMLRAADEKPAAPVQQQESQKPKDGSGAAMPTKTQLFNDQHSAIAVQTDKDVKFVLYYRGFLQSGLAQNSRSDGTWSLNGKVLIIDKRAFALRYTSAEPETLYLDGKPYALSSAAAKSDVATARTGRVFVLHDEGEPIQFDHTLPLRNKTDLAALAKFADGTPKQQQESQKPAEGAQLKPGTEQKLKWGEPTNGLRMALAWPPSLGEPGMGDAPEFYLVVQNVSQAAVRLTANDAAPNPRKLTLQDETPVSRTVDEVPIPGDWLLQPREAAFVRLFHSDEKLKDGRTLSAAKEQIVRVQPQYSYVGEMSIPKAPAGAWTGTLVTGATRGSVDVILPKDKGAQALYKTWTTVARTDGKIPGGVIGLLGESVKKFIEYNPTWKTTPQLEKMLPRFDASRDWPAQDAVSLLDELADVQATPISMASDREYERTIRTGTPLPPQLANAPWGEPLPNGLRLAWLLERRVGQYHLGTPLKSRVLIHNAGKTPVVFRTGTFHQVGHTARDANGAEIKVESTYWTTLSRLMPFRLAPGEFGEVTAPSVGVGARSIKNDDDWQNIRVGSWIAARDGDVVTVTTSPLPLYERNEEAQTGAEPRWWLEFITARLARHSPVPDDDEERKRLLYKIAMELFGNPVNEEITAAFVADREPTALDSLAKRLAKYSFVTPFAGSLQSGPTKFAVLPPDSDAAARPRIANNPGWYTLGEQVRLDVSRRPVGERIVNEAKILFFSRDPKVDQPGKPVALNLPDGYDTWATAWLRGGTVLWVQQKNDLRSYDFTNPAQVKETILKEPADLEKIPKAIRDSLRAALDVPAASKPASPKPAAESPKS